MQAHPDLIIPLDVCALLFLCFLSPGRDKDINIDSDVTSGIGMMQLPSDKSTQLHVFMITRLHLAPGIKEYVGQETFSRALFESKIYTF